MCYVKAAKSDDGSGGDDGGSEGSLVMVTSAGGVHVWGVPALEDVGTEGTGAELTMPLLATHSLKVGRASEAMTPHPLALGACLFVTNGVGVSNTTLSMNVTPPNIPTSSFGCSGKSGGKLQAIGLLFAFGYSILSLVSVLSVP